MLNKVVKIDGYSEFYLFFLSYLKDVKEDILV